MAHYDLEEQEQIDTLKTWWKIYGNLVTTVVTVLALVAVAYQGWNWYRTSQSSQASAIYAVLEQAVAMGDNQKIKAAAGELTEKFSGTSYASLGAMLAARQSFDAGDLKTARTQLGWVAENGKNEFRDIARLRLVAVQLDEKAYDDALAQIEKSHAPAFDARFAELKGDVLLAQGKKADALAAYKAALEKIPADTAGSARELLQQKLDSLGGAA